MAGPSRDLSQLGTAPLPPLGHVYCPHNPHKILTAHGVATFSDSGEDSVPAYGSAKP